MNKSQESEKSNFSKGLKHFLNRCSLDEKEISKQCGVSSQLVYNWLKGTNIPTYKSLQKLHVLGMHVTEMFSNPDLGSVEEHSFIENQNQWTLEELKESLLFSNRRFTIISLKSGIQKAFNELPKNDKIDFLCKSISERIAELEELNEMIKDISKSQSPV